MQAYRDGGNAIDAAVVAAAVLTVVYPHNVALGGDLVALVRTPDGEVRCVNASGWAGADTDVADLRARHGRWLPARGADPVTVPGGVRGWEALRGFGARLGWAGALSSAESLARTGAPSHHRLPLISPTPRTLTCSVPRISTESSAPAGKPCAGERTSSNRRWPTASRPCAKADPTCFTRAISPRAAFLICGRVDRR